ncbi:Vesicular inhibitory amino acid transporter [Eumeta japonica]|uniref:Vesicular inhibitory amino acid transporter n=1 Tax=Eumeta variegata TaxID=151549 RepID=A0A4C2AC90_EUMVA|nr:Vesicular inhibitory amino acid transporter [Eumeta japonica]
MPTIPTQHTKITCVTQQQQLLTVHHLPKTRYTPLPTENIASSISNEQDALLKNSKQTKYPDSNHNYDGYETFNPMVVSTTAAGSSYYSQLPYSLASQSFPLQLTLPLQQTPIPSSVYGQVAHNQNQSYLHYNHYGSQIATQMPHLNEGGNSPSQLSLMSQSSPTPLAATLVQSSPYTTHSHPHHHHHHHAHPQPHLFGSVPSSPSVLGVGEILLESRRDDEISNIWQEFRKLVTLCKRHVNTCPTRRDYEQPGEVSSMAQPNQQHHQNEPRTQTPCIRETKRIMALTRQCCFRGQFFCVREGEGGGGQQIDEMQAAWNVTNAIQGMFIVSLPFAVLHGGYWALVYGWHCLHLLLYGKVLVQCLYEEPDPATGQLVRVRDSYVAIAKVCFGPKLGARARLEDADVSLSNEIDDWLARWRETTRPKFGCMRENLKQKWCDVPPLNLGWLPDDL